jgi:hypothetical protein
MPSLRKLAANRRNSKASTGPRTPQGKAAVAGNATTHGLRAKESRLYWEPDDCERIHLELTQEWQPTGHSERNLVEQMAISEARLIRLEREMTQACYQSEFMKSAGITMEYTDRDPDVVATPQFLDRMELEAQKLIHTVSRQIEVLERSWHKSLDRLLKLQDRRHSREATQNKKNDEQSHRWGDSLTPNEGDGDHSENSEKKPPTSTVQA